MHGQTELTSDVMSIELNTERWMRTWLFTIGRRRKKWTCVRSVAVCVRQHGNPYWQSGGCKPSETDNEWRTPKVERRSERTDLQIVRERLVAVVMNADETCSWFSHFIHLRQMACANEFSFFLLLYFFRRFSSWIWFLCFSAISLRSVYCVWSE